MPYRVLVIDDSEAVRTRLISAMSSIPAAEVVGAAATADDGIALAAAEQPHLVTLDLIMPGRSGLHAIPELRQVAPECEIVVFTDYPYPEARRHCLDLGVTHLLSKAQDFAKLLTIVKERSQAFLE
ncbi:MAG: response regulator transcription factor [Gemmatimonadota bacterium]